MQLAAALWNSITAILLGSDIDGHKCQVETDPPKEQPNTTI